MSKEIHAVPRDWQLDARAAEIAYLEDGGTKPLIAGCPGAGKTLYGVIRGCDFFNNEGGQLIIVVAPTVNIKRGWITEFRLNGFKTTGDVQNALIEERLERGRDIKEEQEVIVVTYAQLAKADDLFQHYPRRYRVMVIADEVHHADDRAEYGIALQNLADPATRRLALSGTPFNSKGGALSMCDCEPGVDDEGNAVMQTKPCFSYSYGEALADQNCRVIQFGIIYGKATTTYESLLTGKTFERITQGQRRSDSLRPFLDPNGEFLPTMLGQAIERLDALKKHDRRAAMLIVAQDATASREIEDWLDEHCDYNIQRIVHDTERAHDRIERLPKDNTDIVIAIRMISEGINVKRFRVGVFASDYTTRLFFIQFVGRFIRWDNDLPDEQHAILLFPGHVRLVEYARDIEKMIVAAELTIGDGPAGTGGDTTTTKIPEYVKVGAASEVTEQQTMARGATLDVDDETLVQQWYEINPDARGRYPDYMIADILRRAKGRASPASAADPLKDLHNQNMQAVNLVVRLLRGKTRHTDDDSLYGHVQGTANQAVGIHKVDALTTEDQLRRRQSYLKRWAQALLRGEPDA